MITVWIEKQRAKAVLLQVFKSGNIGVTYTYGNTNGTIYPKIRNVHFDYNKKAVLYTFSLPVGMDPKEIKKKEYCLQQVFGENIEIEGDYREFKLIVSLQPLFRE